MRFAVDLVMCIDGTASMEGFLLYLRKQALDLWQNISEMADVVGMSLRSDWFRVKVIVFRNNKEDGETAMEESAFFMLPDPQGAKAFNEFIQGFEPHGNGDKPKNALEAIFTAIKSDWVTQFGRFRRQVILLITDGPALPLHEEEQKRSKLSGRYASLHRRVGGYP